MPVPVVNAVARTEFEATPPVVCPVLLMKVVRVGVCLGATRCGGGSFFFGTAGVVVLRELDCGLFSLALRATTA